MIKSSRSLSSRKNDKITNKRNKSVQDSGSYGNFLDFQESQIGQSYKQFMYMQEFFNTNLVQFPTDEEICQIQHNLHVSSGLQNHKKKNWTLEEKKVLIWVVGKLSQVQDLDIRDLPDEFWNDVSKMIYRRDSVQCKQKWSQLQKTDLQSKPFTQDEDQLLLNIISQFQEGEQGYKWSLISNELNLHNKNYRSSKQCRERWLNHINPKIKKDPWNDDEDFKLLNFVLEHGRKWADISKLFNETRSENNVKNRFNSLIKREKDLIVQLQNGSIGTLETILGNLTGSILNIDQISAIEVLKNKIIWRQGQSKDDQNLNNIRKSSINYDSEKKEKTQMKKSTVVKYSVGHLDENQISSEELTPCLVNIEKNIIYFCSQEQILQIINTQINQIKNNLENYRKELFRNFDSALINQKTQLSIISEINDSQFSSFICGIEDNQSSFSKPNFTYQKQKQIQQLDYYLNQSSKILEEKPEAHKYICFNPIESIHYKAFHNIYKAYKSENILNKTSQVFQNIPKSLPNVVTIYSS